MLRNRQLTIPPSVTYSARLRRMEVLQIKARDIDSQRMQVRIVQGKGKKDRYTILSWKTLEVLRMYYKLERPTTYLFEPMGRKGQPLSERTVEYIVKNSAKNAGNALIQCAKNTHYLGAEAGAAALLHTWGQTMTYHPHIHTIVPAGGLQRSDN